MDLYAMTCHLSLSHDADYHTSMNSWHMQVFSSSFVAGYLSDDAPQPAVLV
jgi:hypothetical protein